MISQLKREIKKIKCKTNYYRLTHDYRSASILAVIDVYDTDEWQNDVKLRSREQSNKL